MRKPITPGTLLVHTQCTSLTNTQFELQRPRLASKEISRAKTNYSRDAPGARAFFWSNEHAVRAPLTLSRQKITQTPCVRRWKSPQRNSAITNYSTENYSSKQLSVHSRMLLVHTQCTGLTNTQSELWWRSHDVRKYRKHLVCADENLLRGTKPSQTTLRRSTAARGCLFLRGCSSWCTRSALVWTRGSSSDDDHV